MAWCSHCSLICQTQVSGQFLSCSRCGKVLAEILDMRKISKWGNIRSKRRKRKKKIRDQTFGIDKFEVCLQEHKKVGKLSQKYFGNISTSNVYEESTSSSRQLIYDDQVLLSIEESTVTDDQLR